MTAYTAPLEDMQFAMWQVLDFEKHYSKLPSAEDATMDTVNAVLAEGARFGREVVSPLNAVGDAEGCSLDDGVVTTPAGFREAYRQYIDGGWPSMTVPTEFGGQGLPQSLGTVLSEINATANWSWWMYPGLSHGAMNTIEAHGTEAQKNTYLDPMVSGEWTGTMCLTESHCGTDLGLLKTRAEANEDGSYAITGQKIFISSGALAGCPKRNTRYISFHRSQVSAARVIYGCLGSGCGYRSAGFSICGCPKCGEVRVSGREDGDSWQRDLCAEF